jgi:hypothetical protein
MTKLTSHTGFALAALFLFLSAPAARGQDIYQTVARISYASEGVSYSRGDDPDQWEPAFSNVPFTLGDRIYAPGDGRAELQLPGGNFIRLGHRTYLSTLNLTYDTKQFYIGEGAVSLNIRRLADDEIFEIDTPNVAVTLDARGSYRIEVDEDGNSRIIVRRGRVVVAAQGRQITVEEGEIRVYGTDSPRYEMVSLRGADAFDRWVEERDARYERAYPRAYRYASDQIVGAEELEEYGRWEEVPEYGYAWTPSRIQVGWQPFTVGHWFWQDPWGWTWISEEPWGWATCHYGRWTFYRSRWYWVPDRPRVQVVTYAPAVVAFVSFGDHVGWFPLHPRDRLAPWWGPRVEVVQNVTYVNRTYITIVNQNTFVSARSVNVNIVRDSTVIRQATSVRVMEQPLPVPSRVSLRVNVERSRERAQQPSAKILTRPVVVRTAPPPPPPTFNDKLPEIQKNRGRPVAPDRAVALGLKNVEAPNRHKIKPAAVEGGRADFAPRGQGGSAPASQPITPSKGKKLATQQEPVLTQPPRGGAPEQPGAPTGPSKGAGKAFEPQEQKKEERERKKEEKQLQEQPRKEERPFKKEDQRDLERQQKQQEQERKKQEKQIQEPPGKEQKQFQKEPQRPELEREQKKQEPERKKEEKPFQEQPRKEPRDLQKEQREEKQPQKQEKQPQEQAPQKGKQREEQPLQKQPQQQDQQFQKQQRDDQIRGEQERKQKLQEQERQKQEKQPQEQGPQKGRQREEQPLQKEAPRKEQQELKKEQPPQKERPSKEQDSRKEKKGEEPPPPPPPK